MLEYIVEVTPDSVWDIATITAQAQRLSFYLIECGYFFAKANYYTKRNNSDMYLLFATISGKGKLFYEGDEYILEKNTIVVISCDAFHHYASLSEEIWVFRWITFNGTAATEFYKLINPNGINILNTVKIIEYAEMLEEVGKHYKHQELVYSLQVSSIINKILTDIIIERIEGERIGVGGIERLKPIIEFIDHHYGQKVSLQELADMMFISKFYFIILFRTNMGVTPHEYLVNLRIKKAKELLVRRAF